MRESTGGRGEEPTAQQLLRAITGGPNVTLVADETETIHFAGGGVEALFGYTPEELVGESVDLLVPAEFTDQHHAAMARYLDTGTRHLDWDGVGLVAQHRDGHTVPVDVSLSDTETESGRLLAATFRRQSSRESSERFDTHRAFSASVFENVNDAVVVATPDGEVLDANPATSDLLGRDYADLLDASVFELLGDEDAEFGLAVPFEDGDSAEVTVEREDGDRVVLDLSVADIMHEGETAYLLTGRNVTDRVDREEELARQNERLDRFTSIVSHDLRNPLSVAHANAHLVADGRTEYIDDVLDGLGDMNQLIDDLLTLARNGEILREREPVSLATVARDAWDSVDREGDVTLELDGDTVLEGDPDRIEQALVNLFVNAITHGRGDETDALTVTVGTTEDGFYVADDGVGIPPESADKVFEHGHTTAEQGTGYGLSIVSEIVGAHGWAISLADTETGTRFEIRT
ncbi:sensor histidine kinase [Halosegnis longus]|uniref:sensor histidine kinase n=1 Tax=Halosegnis longus TaxID=2216012 RepID=UPI001562039A|nr:PAS domain-containing sensor histidine kinase [Halosegnis longus]